jgi:hypothetical protein
MTAPIHVTERNIYDLKTAYGICLGAVFLALFIGYIFLFLIKRFAAIMVYSSIVLIEAGLIIGGYVVYDQARYKQNLNSNLKKRECSIIY